MNLFKKLGKAITKLWHDPTVEAARHEIEGQVIGNVTAATLAPLRERWNELRRKILLRLDAGELTATGAVWTLDTWLSENVWRES